VNRKRLQAFLEDLGWTVLSPLQYPNEEYLSLLERDLKECLAFIQLLGSYPWRRVDYDRVQNKTAEDLKIPRFRYRSSEIDLTHVDETHKQFITEPDIICRGFEDFKDHLKQKEAAHIAARSAHVLVTAPENPPATFDLPVLRKSLVKLAKFLPSAQQRATLLLALSHIRHYGE
jgi:hypothetical protein